MDPGDRIALSIIFIALLVLNLVIMAKVEMLHSFNGCEKRVVIEIDKD